MLQNKFEPINESKMSRASEIPISYCQIQKSFQGDTKIRNICDTNKFVK
jgi:hypothetical protein